MWRRNDSEDAMTDAAWPEAPVPQKEDALVVANNSDIDSPVQAPAREIIYAYEPAVSHNIVQRSLLSSTLPRGLPASSGSSIEEQIIFEENDHNANITRRQIYSRTSTPASFWDKHTHFSQWARSIFISLLLLSCLVIGWKALEMMGAGIDHMVSSESDAWYSMAQYANRVYKRNRCHELEPPEELLERCAELDRLRLKDYTNVPHIFGLVRMIKELVQILIIDLSWKGWASLLVPPVAVSAIYRLWR